MKEARISDKEMELNACAVTKFPHRKGSSSNNVKSQSGNRDHVIYYYCKRPGHYMHETAGNKKDVRINTVSIHTRNPIILTFMHL